MFVRRLTWAALLGLSVFAGRGVLAGEPAPLVLPMLNPNQKLADAVAEHLRQSGVLRQYTVDITVRGGDVELSGQVADQAQRDEVRRLVQGVPGVDRVVDRLKLASQGSGVTPIQVPALPPPPAPPSSSEAPKAGGNGNGSSMPEPVPMHRGHPQAFSELAPPRMPPYAWPSYAPYNNYSRVAYPEAYPWQSWPFIGPTYPFPKVPLGWRSVKLTWDDGYWWYGQVGNKWNWWKLRYW